MRRSLVLLWCLLLFLASAAWARLPSQAAYDALKTDITVTNQAEFAQDVANRDYQHIADAYNKLASPDYYVWKTALKRSDIYQMTVVDVPPTQTTWNWATYQSQSVQQRDSWHEMLVDGVINPSLPQVRANYNTIFGGQGASAQQQQFLLAISRRKALRAETIQVSGTGSDLGQVTNPGTLTWEGPITANDVGHALDPNVIIQ